MSLITQTIPNLINGVSQQPEVLRLSSQCEVQENWASTPSEGLRKRAGTVSKGIILEDVGVDSVRPFVHGIKRDDQEEYILWIEDGDLFVYDLEGNEKTVNFPDGKLYLAAAEPVKAFRAVTVADFTFILNRNFVVESDTAVLPERNPEALIWVKQGDYDETYEILIDGVTAASVRTSSSEVITTQTQNIANALFDGTAPGAFNVTEHLTDNLDPADWTRERFGSTIYIQRDDGTNFRIGYIDGKSDTSLGLIKDSVQSFTDLPKTGRSNFNIRIEGDEKEDEDDYYVKYVITDPSPEKWRGVWKETLKLGEQYRLNDATMPHILVREGDGTFTFRKADWAEREVGDLESNPFPSFVGQKVNDIHFHRNRLGFLAGENVIYSRAGEFFNFFRSTATQVLDSDPIDVAITSDKVSILNHAISFDRTVAFLSSNAQFMLGSVDILTPETIAINETTNFASDPNFQPSKIGRFLYFGSNESHGALVREYFVDPDARAEDATDITSHVPTYIPPGAVKISSSPNQNTMVILSELDPKALYVYRFYWSGQQKLQSSWSRYTFEHCDRILGMEFFSSRLAIVTQKGTLVTLEVLDFAMGGTDADFGVSIHLDRMLTQDDVGVSFADGVTTIDLTGKEELPTEMGTYTIIAGPDQEWLIGDVVPFTRVNASTLTVEGELTNFRLGFAFTSRYRFSTIYPRDQRNPDAGALSLGTGRLQLRTLTFAVAPSVEFRVEVTPEGRRTYVYHWSSFRPGTDTLETITPRSDHFRVPIGTKNISTIIEIVNDSHWPAAFSNGEWEGMFTDRARRS